MKKINTKTSKKIVAVILATVAAFAVMGCSVEKNFTVTETHTETDANGNTITTTTTNHNGEVTTETTSTTADKSMASNEEEIEVEEINADDPVVFEKIPVIIENNMDWDIASIKLKMADSDEWSDNFLEKDQWLDHDQAVRGIVLTYTDEERFIDLDVADSDGNGIVFDDLEMPTEEVDKITISLVYDEVDNVYRASVIG